MGLFLCFLSPYGKAQDLDPSVVSEGLLRDLNNQPEAYHPVFFQLADRVDVAALSREWKASRKPVAERGPQLLNMLQEKAESTQAPLLKYLQQAEGVAPGSIQRFWVNNTVFASVRREVVAELSQWPAIARIGQNLPSHLADGQASCSPEAASPIPNGREPGLTAINAHRLWALGYTGYGTKALVIDSGQDDEHPALRRQFAWHNLPFNQVWGGSGDVGFCDSHGLHVTGTVLGLDRLNNDTIGVAFNATWIGGPVNLGGVGEEGCGSNPDPTFPNSTVTALQYGLNPDGNPGTTDDVPDVVNNSWGNAASCIQAQSLYAPIWDAYDALGVALVTSAGNDGPGQGTVSSPALLISPNVFSVGAVNGNVGTYPIAGFSSRGPSPCDDATIKPEVVAPGVQVRSAVGNNSYDNFDGTSMASPHVSGAVLLLKEAFPNLEGDDFLQALYFTAEDLGNPGEDNAYGNGLIDVFAAYQYLVNLGNTPAPPASDFNDLILLNAQYPLVSCAGEVKPRILLENAGQNAVNSFTYTFDPSGLPETSGQLSLDEPLEPGERRAITLPAFNVPVSSNREVRVEVSAPNGQTDERMLDNGLKSRISVINDIPPMVELEPGSAACSGGQVVVRSNFSGEGDVRWYDDFSEGSLLAEGTTALIDVPQGVSEYSVFAETEVPGRVGKNDPAGGAFFSNAEQGLRFDCFAPFTLQSVVVVAEQAGNRVVRLRLPDGGVVNRIVNVPGTGEQRIELDLDIEPGENYQLILFNGAALQYNVGSATTDYPYEVPNVVSITRGTNGGTFYNYFYDWEISYTDPCGRQEVVIPVDPDGTAPTAAFSPSSTMVDLAAGGQVTFTDESAGATNWNWDFGDGNTSTQQNPTHTYTDTGLFPVTLTADNGQGCSDASVAILEVVNSTRVRNLNSLDDLVRVYPNPTTGRIWVDIQEELQGEVVLRVTDMLGRQVMPDRPLAPAAQQFSLDLGSLPSGAYSIILQAADGRAVKRVLRM